MKKHLFFVIIMCITVKSYAQTQPTSISQEDITQGEKFISAYFNPMSRSFGSSLNNGWYNTAKPHSLGGFDLTVTFNTVIIPDEAKLFNIQEAGGSIFVSNSSEAATIFGSSEKTDMSYVSGAPAVGGFGVPFEMPGGIIETKYISLPMIQAGIGLIKNTALDFRFMPLVNVGDAVKANLFGIGVKHDILQWIPGIGDAIPMSLSLQAGYTSLNTELNIEDQDISLNTKATTINLVASKKIVMITGYAGLGYNASSTNLKADANFDIGGVQFDESHDFSLESKNNLRANIGLRFNITLVTIHADYTFAEYPTATLGLGVSFR